MLDFLLRRTRKHKTRKNIQGVSQKWLDAKGLESVAPDLISTFHALPEHHDNSEKPEMIELNENRAVWQIPVRGHTRAYMQISRQPHCNEKTSIVMVKAREFYTLWRAAEMRNDNQTYFQVPEVSKIPLDGKWPQQAAYWDQSRINPVALAEVGWCEMHGINFGDGITSTLWLIYHMATAFPVSVKDHNSAVALHTAAGDPSYPVISLAELLRPTSLAVKSLHKS